MRRERGTREHAPSDGRLEIPDLSLVLLVGASGCGKSTFARTHFKATEVVSSDQCRGIVSDDENAQDATTDAFDLLRYIARIRLRNGKKVVVDATNVQEAARKEMLQLAWQHHVPAVAIVFLFDEAICQERNSTRPDRQFGPHVIRNQTRDLRRSLGNLFREGFRHVYVLRSPQEVEAAQIITTPLWPDFKHIHGPFDIIGDIHGCWDELQELLGKLGYTIADLGSRISDLPEVQSAASEDRVDATDTPDPRSAIPDPRSQGLRPDSRWRPETFFQVVHPENRKLIFLGDLVDRGPNTPQVLKLVMSAVATGVGYAVPGNHDDKLMRKLKGKDVRVAHGMAQSLEQLDLEPEGFKEGVAHFLDALVSHLILDDGKLVVAHAGMNEELQGRASSRVRDFALYGETTGETDEFGLPVRYPWAAEYRGKPRVVYGHTPVPEPEWLNRTINLDTGCVFGGKLTALRYPEMELVSVQAREVYAESKKPFLEVKTELSAQQELDDVLDLEDVFGKRIVSTRLRGNITIREENASAALEAMSRFAANPKWLVYLPPTMSPTETTLREGLLEHPQEGFVYFRENAVDKVICEEKHMGSRAVVVVCKDSRAAKERFGIAGQETGCIYTRTGRRFFDNASIEAELLGRVASAVCKAGLWDELSTDWLVLDCELMPWSAKAQELLRKQYAPVGASAKAATSATLNVLRQAAAHTEGLEELLARTEKAEDAAAKFVDAYRQYCWSVSKLEDLKLAPFHILASEGHVHTDKDHDWHMQTLAHLCSEDPAVLFATPYKIIETEDAASVEEGISWWEELTGRGGEGMVIKPLQFIAEGPHGLVQPAVKCRGKEYLRIIYGPEYTLPSNLNRLRKRGLGVKRFLALREFALGVEGLERFVRREPLRQVHECAFAVLAMESEPVDPRL